MIKQQTQTVISPQITVIDSNQNLKLLEIQQKFQAIDFNTPINISKKDIDYIDLQNKIDNVFKSVDAIKDKITTVIKDFVATSTEQEIDKVFKSLVTKLIEDSLFEPYFVVLNKITAIANDFGIKIQHFNADVSCFSPCKINENGIPVFENETTIELEYSFDDKAIGYYGHSVTKTTSPSSFSVLCGPDHQASQY